MTKIEANEIMGFLAETYKKDKCFKEFLVVNNPAVIDAMMNAILPRLDYRRTKSAVIQLKRNYYRIPTFKVILLYFAILNYDKEQLFDMYKIWIKLCKNITYQQIEDESIRTGLKYEWLEIGNGYSAMNSYEGFCFALYNSYLRLFYNYFIYNKGIKYEYLEDGFINVEEFVPDSELFYDDENEQCFLSVIEMEENYRGIKLKYSLEELLESTGYDYYFKLDDDEPSESEAEKTEYLDKMKDLFKETWKIVINGVLEDYPELNDNTYSPNYIDGYEHIPWLVMMGEEKLGYQSFTCRPWIEMIDNNVEKKNKFQRVSLNRFVLYFLGTYIAKEIANITMLYTLISFTDEAEKAPRLCEELASQILDLIAYLDHRYKVERDIFYKVYNVTKDELEETAKFIRDLKDEAISLEELQEKIYNAAYDTLNKMYSKEYKIFKKLKIDPSKEDFWGMQTLVEEKVEDDVITA